LFSLAWHTIVKQLLAELSLTLWYLDDGHLVGPPQVVAAALAIILNCGRELGISLNMAKCKVWGPGNLPPEMGDTAAAEMFSAVPRVPWATGHGDGTGTSVPGAAP
jgi:hypothetical protein